MTILLYPQLLGPAVPSSIARVKALAIGELLKIQSSPPDLSDASYSQVGGNRVSPDMLIELRDRIVDVAQMNGFPDKRSQKPLQKFDSECAVLLRTVMNVSQNEASRSGVWAFLACHIAPAVVRWRFPGDDTQGTSAQRFGGGVRNCFQRLWWRAEILADPGRQPEYWILEKLGEDEIVQLMERPTVRADRRLARVTCAAFLSAAEEHPSVSRMALMRDIQPRILRLMSFLAFESISDHDLDTIILGIVKESIESISAEER